MKLTDDDIRKIATLARLEVSKDDFAKLAEQMNEIVGYVELLQDLDTSAVSPTSHTTVAEPHLRDDVAVPSIGAENATAAAPASSGGAFKVPAVIE